MANYLLVYHGGGEGLPETEEGMAELMAAWQGWFGALGDAVVDGGNPVGPSHTLTTAGASEGGGANPATGYSIISASSMDDALEKSKGCPVLAGGGSIEVCQIVPVG